VKIWNQLVENVKNYGFSDRTTMYRNVNCTPATSYNYDTTITFFVVAQQ